MELTLASEAELQEEALGRPTIGLIYGRVTIGIPRSEANDGEALGSWGIRLKESDAPATAFGAFSPIQDGGSSDWITWRDFSLLKTEAVGTQGDVLGFDFETYDLLIRNPRKVDTDEELVLLLENSLNSTVGIAYTAHLRTMLVLP